MKTLYDVLGARPDDDAASLKKAYRKAAKAHHPDHHAGDPGAALRFRQVNAAYDILRDAEQRAVYDRMLETGREALRIAAKQAALRRRRAFVSNAIAAAVVTVMLAGGLMLFTRLSGISIVDMAGLAARGLAHVAALQPAGRAAAPQIPIMVPDMPNAVASAVSGAAASAQTKAESPEVRPGRGTM